MRLSLPETKSHPFYDLFTDKGGNGIKIGIDTIPLDNNILEEMPALGYEKESTRRYIETNRHNAACTTYYLLLKKKLKQGFHSYADINSDNFDPRLKEKDNPL